MSQSGRFVTKIVRGVVLERLVVPEPLRLFISIDVASQPGQHRGLIHNLAFRLVHREALGEMQCDVGLPQHMLGGVAEPKVGTEGQRGEEFRHPYAGSIHSLIVRLPKGLCQEASCRSYGTVG
jgi:hypothetical protein